MSKASEIIDAFTKAKTARSIVESTWEDIVYFTNPRKRGVVSKHTPGEKTPPDVYDGTAPQSNIVLAAGLSGFVTNPAHRWLELGKRGKQYEGGSDEAKWLADAANAVYFALSASNFYGEIHESYLDFGPFGLCILFSEEDATDDLRFYSISPKELYLTQNSKKRIDRVFRYCTMTCYEAYDMFGPENLPEEIRKCYEEKKDYNKDFMFIHYVAPRHKRKAGSDEAKDKPFESIWVSELDKDKVLKEGGFDEFPYAIAMFYKNNYETYPYGPAHVIYPDIRMINNMTKTYYESAEVALWPPSLMEHDSIIGSLDYRAKAINYQKQPLSRGKAVEPMLNGANFQIGIDFIDRVEQKVEKAFFVDLFLALRQTKRMTATEVVEISQERMFMLGPVLNHLHEFLTSVIIRTVNILLKRGKIELPPAGIGNNIDVIYVSPLARAQRAMQSKDLRTFNLVISEMAAMSPSVLDVVNWDEAAKEAHQMFSVSPKIIHSDEETQGIRTKRQAAIEQAQKIENMKNMADAANKAGSAAKGFTDAARPTTVN